jgi:hypothetical protein
MDKVGSLTERVQSDLRNSDFTVGVSHSPILEPRISEEMQTRKVLAFGLLQMVDAETVVRRVANENMLPHSEVVKIDAESFFGSTVAADESSYTHSRVFMVGYGIKFEKIHQQTGTTIPAIYVVGLTDKNTFGTVLIDINDNPDITNKLVYNKINQDSTLQLDRKQERKGHLLAPVILGGSINPDMQNMEELREVVREVIANDAIVLKKFI